MKNMKKSVESFDDIIFENRNKDYGAYELRKSYGKRGKIAISIALFIVLVAVGLPLIASFMKEQNINNLIDIGVVIDMENIKDKVEIEPPKLPDLPKPDIKSIIYKPNIVDSLTKDEEIEITDDVIKNTTNLPIDTSTHQDLVITDNNDDLIDNSKPLEIFEIDEQPIFPGGTEELFKYLASTKYPIDAQENGIEGTVYIRFVVTKTGDIGDAQIYKAADPILNEAAVISVKNMPRWTPGKKNGRPKDVWFIVPIKFKLEH